MNSQKQQTAALIQQGLDLLNNNKLEEAKTLCTQLCQSNPQEAEAWYLLSSVYGRLGEITMAGECCRRVLEIQPNHFEALVNLGNVLFAQKNLDEAATQYRKALQLNPHHAAAHSNLGNLLAAEGKYDEAVTCYQTAIKVDPNLFIAYYSLGNLRLTQKQYDKAANCYGQAIQLSPNDASCWNFLGIALLGLDKIDEALSSFRKAVDIKPDYLEARNNISNALVRQGKQDEALEQYQLAIQYAPTSPEAHNRLGLFYAEQGQMNKAISCYQNALKIDPQYLAALNNLGHACYLQGNLNIYISHYRQAIERLTEVTAARLAFIENLQNIVPSAYDPWFDIELTKCFSLSNVNYGAISRYTIHHLKHKYDIKDVAGLADTTIKTIIGHIATDELFLQFLEKTFTADADLELFLTKVRRKLLFENSSKDDVQADELRVIKALAFQGLNNEYVFDNDDEEDSLLVNLKHSIEALISNRATPTRPLECKLLVFGMYSRLDVLACRAQINNIPLEYWSESFRPFLEQTLSIPLEEEKIKHEIPTIGNIEDQTSKLVQSQYEENPYPRWVSLPEITNSNFKDELATSFPHYTPPSFLDGPIKILIAGCGTGQQPIQIAMCYNNAEVLAVDISKSSLAYAIRMAKKYGVKNIRFMQGDILQLSELNKKFHIIMCTGVLHHMNDPLAGWKVLTTLLEKNGLMKVALYSELARRYIVVARETIKNENITPTNKNIRHFRRKIMTHEMGDFLYQNTYSRDFYTTSRCRDLLFHFMEHRFTLSQISKALFELNLEFIGFNFPFQPESNRATKLYLADFPDDPEMRNLTLWNKFEAKYPDTFAGMYNFWCQRMEGGTPGDN